MISERVIVLAFQQPMTILGVIVGLCASVVGGKFGAVVRRDELLIVLPPVGTGRWTLGRGEATILLLWEGSERVLVLGVEGIGGAGWV